MATEDGSLEGVCTSFTFEAPSQLTRDYMASKDHTNDIHNVLCYSHRAIGHKVRRQC